MMEESQIRRWLQERTGQEARDDGGSRHGIDSIYRLKQSGCGCHADHPPSPGRSTIVGACFRINVIPTRINHQGPVMGMVRVTSVRIVAFSSSTVSVSADSFTATFQLFRDCRCSECRNCAGAPKRPARAGGLCGSRLALPLLHDRRGEHHQEPRERGQHLRLSHLGHAPAPRRLSSIGRR